MVMMLMLTTMATMAMMASHGTMRTYHLTESVGSKFWLLLLDDHVAARLSEQRVGQVDAICIRGETAVLKASIAYWKVDAVSSGREVNDLMN